MVAGSHMKTPITSPGRLTQARAVIEICEHGLEFGASQPAQIAFRAQHGTHLVPTGIQRVHEVRSNETGGSCNKAFHRQRRKS